MIDTEKYQPASLTRQQTSYSGSAGWYFWYQSIHIQITYTYIYFVHCHKTTTKYWKSIATFIMSIMVPTDVNKEVYISPSSKIYQNYIKNTKMYKTWVLPSVYISIDIYNVEKNNNWYYTFFKFRDRTTVLVLIGQSFKASVSHIWLCNNRIINEIQCFFAHTLQSPVAILKSWPFVPKIHLWHKLLKCTINTSWSNLC